MHITHAPTPTEQNFHDFVVDYAHYAHFTTGQQRLKNSFTFILQHYSFHSFLRVQPLQNQVTVL